MYVVPLSYHTTLFMSQAATSRVCVWRHTTPGVTLAFTVSLAALLVAVAAVLIAMARH
jgi:hypothetical protein